MNQSSFRCLGKLTNYSPYFSNNLQFTNVAADYSFTFSRSRSLRMKEYLLPTLEQAHSGSTPECNLRSRFRWFTEFCNSHDLSQFAALFIDLGTKVSTDKSCLKLYIVFFIIVYNNRIVFTSHTHEHSAKWRKNDIIPPYARTRDIYDDLISIHYKQCLVKKQWLFWTLTSFQRVWWIEEVLQLGIPHCRTTSISTNG